jgi:hypothetical protein
MPRVRYLNNRLEVSYDNGEEWFPLEIGTFDEVISAYYYSDSSPEGPGYVFVVEQQEYNENSYGNRIEIER